MSEPPPAQRAFWPTCAYARPGGRGTRLMLSRRPIQALDQGVVSLVRKHPLNLRQARANVQVTDVAPDPGGMASHGR
jgi:hypothetical protein